MPASGFRDGAEALSGPLRFAARDDYAQLARVRDLDRVVVRGCAHLHELAIPADLKQRILTLTRRFERVGEEAELRRAIADALLELRAWLRPGFGDELLSRPISHLKGVGGKRAEALASRRLRNIGDLLFYLPTQYDDRRSLERVGELEVGRRATFLARVIRAELGSNRTRGRFGRILEVVVGDETGTVVLKWFRGGSSIQKDLVPGSWVVVTGDVKRYRFTKELVHPELEVASPPGTELQDEKSKVDTDLADHSRGPGDIDVDALRNVVPSYPTPEGLNPRTLRRLIHDAVASYSDLWEGFLPESLVKEMGLPEPGVALRLVHAPELQADLERYAGFRSPAHERLVLEELYLLELGLMLRREERGSLPGIAIDVGGERVRAASHSLPFSLTRAQERALREIHADLSRPHPMNRLLQGDVGCGKTAVALLAAVAVATAGRQTALMAPTELLAEQHARTLRQLSKASRKVLGLRIELLTSSIPRAEADAITRALAEGEIDLLVGTHALVQESVVFRDLALAIVDEQHRFGVLQRAALSERGAGDAQPHVLVMTATPIPRTLALTAYGDLDVSVIDELPPGRQPGRTLLMREGEGRRIMDILADTVERGEQAYIVYPLVEESEKIDLRSALESAEKIAAFFPQHRVGVVHGRLDAAERGRIMEEFTRGEIDILVATTVIEVGVDVPNATLMIVEHADRFGLAQLHQLRGRVGRGDQPGTCILMARQRGRVSEQRLLAMMKTTDGFEIAEADLRIRGPGEFLGTQQSGVLTDLRLADLVRDARLVARAREAASQEVRRNPRLQQTPELRRAVEVRWGERLDLVRVG